MTNEPGIAYGKRLSGRVAVVTGAGGPMGAAIALRLAQEGAQLALTDISDRRLQANAQEIEQRCPGSVLLAQRGSAVIEAEVDDFCGALGSKGVDILVNVVGGIRFKEIYKPFYEVPESRWNDTFEFNLKGIFYLVRRLCPGMQARGRGAVVNISSMVYPGEANQTDYAAAKAAVASLSRSLALEFAPSVRVNCIAPGFIATTTQGRMPEDEYRELLNRTPLKRMGKPEDIAAAVAFLASDDSAYITGALLPVAGGIKPSL